LYSNISKTGGAYALSVCGVGSSGTWKNIE
jgi:hypothetical protein